MKSSNPATSRRRKPIVTPTLSAELERGPLDRHEVIVWFNDKWPRNDVGCTLRDLGIDTTTLMFSWPATGFNLTRDEIDRMASQKCVLKISAANAEPRPPTTFINQWRMFHGLPETLGRQLGGDAFCTYGERTGTLADAILKHGGKHAVVIGATYAAKNLKVSFETRSAQELLKDARFKYELGDMTAVVTSPHGDDVLGEVVDLIELAPKVIYFGEGLSFQSYVPLFWLHCCSRRILSVERCGTGILVCYGSEHRKDDEPVLWEELIGLILPGDLMPPRTPQKKYEDLFSPLCWRNINAHSAQIRSCHQKVVDGTVQEDDTEAYFNELLATLSPEQRKLIVQHNESEGGLLSKTRA